MIAEEANKIVPSNKLMTQSTSSGNDTRNSCIFRN